MEKERRLKLKTKVAYVIPTLTLGGAERQQINILNCLDGDKFDIKVYVLKWDIPLSSMIKRRDIEIKRYKIDSPLSLIEISKFFKDVASFSPDIIHSHMYSANILSRGLKMVVPKAKIINHYHGLSNWLTDSKLLIEQKTKSLVDRFIVVSKESLELRLFREGFDVNKTILLINSVDFEVGAEVCQRFLDRKDGDKLIIGMASRLIALKNIEGAIFMTKFLLDSGLNVELHIAGDGEHRQNLESYAKGLGLLDSIKFFGFMEDMQSFYKNIDIFCISSTTEDTPLSVLEASMSGRAVIASKVGGLKHLFEGNSCAYLVNNFFNRDELSRVKKFIEELNLNRCCKEMNSLANREFSNRKYCIKLEEIYRELLNEESSS
jgi:glycosyltransferase involved in cell wall biosynthesis